MANKENLTVKIKVDGQEASRAVGKFAKSLDRAGDEAQDASKQVADAEGTFKRFGKAAIAINQSLELVSKTFRVIQQVTSKPLINAAALERSTAEVRTLLDATQKDVVNFNKEILSLQRQFGTQPQVAAKAFYDAISSGAVDASGAIKLLNVAQKTAIGGVTNLQTAVNGITNILNAYGLSASDSARVSDVLFLSMRAGKTTVTELSAELGKVLTFAANAGVSFEELSAAVATVTTAGVQTNIATTAMRAAIVALLRPTEDMKKVYEDLGITSVEATIKQQGLVRTIRQISDSVGGSTAALTKLFGSVESLPAVTALASETIGRKFDELEKNISDSSENIGKATDDAFAELANTAEFKLSLVQARFDATLTEIGFAFKDTFVEVAEIVSESFDSVVTSFNEVAEAAKPAVEAFKAIDFSAIFKAITPLVLTLAGAYSLTLLPAIASATTAFVAQKVTILATAVATGTLTSTMTALIAPMALAAGKALVLVGAFVGFELAVRNISKVTNGFLSLWTRFVLLIDEANESILRLRISFKEAIGADTARDQQKLLDNLRSQVGLQKELVDLAVENEETDFDFGFLGTVFEQAKTAVDAFNGSLGDSKKLAKELNDTVGAGTGAGAGGQLPPTLDPAAISAAKTAFDELAKAQALIGTNEQESARLKLDARLKEIDTIEEQLRTTEQLAGKESELAKARQLAQTEYKETLDAIREEQRKQLEEQLKGFKDLQAAQATYGMNALEAVNRTFEIRMKEIDAIEEQLRLTGQLAGREAELARARDIASQERERGQRLAGPAPAFVQGVQDAVAPVTEAIAGFGSVITGPIAVAQAAIDAAQAIVNAVPNLLNSAADLVNSITDLPQTLLNAMMNIDDALARMATEFIPNLVRSLPQMVETLVSQLVESVPNLIAGLINGIPDLITALIRAIPPLVQGLITGLLTSTPKIAVALVRGIVQGVPMIVVELVKMIPDLVMAIVDGIAEAIGGLGDLFGSMFGGIGETITDGMVGGIDGAIKAITGSTEQLFAVVSDSVIKRGMLERDNIADSLERGTRSMISMLMDFFRGIGNFFLKGFQFAVDNILQPIANVVLSALKWVFENAVPSLVNFIMNGVVEVFKSVGLLATWILNALGEVFKSVGKLGMFIFNAVVWFVEQGVSLIGNLIAAAFKYIFNDLLRIIADILKATLKFIFNDLVNILGDILRAAFEALKEIFLKIGKWIWEGFESVFTLGGNISADTGGGNFISNVFRNIDPTNSKGIVGSTVKTVSDAVGDAISWVGGLFYNGGMVPGLAMVSGDSKTNDVVPAMLSPGEIVLPRSIVDGSMVDMIRFIRQAKGESVSLQSPMSPSTFANGGLVGNLNPMVSALGNNSYNNTQNYQIELNIRTEQPIDEGFIRRRLMPEIEKSLRRSSLDGRRVLSPNGVR